MALIGIGRLFLKWRIYLKTYLFRYLEAESLLYLLRGKMVAMTHHFTVLFLVTT